MTVDYAHNHRAERNRHAKATALAAVARQLGVTSSSLAVGRGRRRDVWKAAGLTRAPSEDTWLAVVDVLGLDEPAPLRGPGRGTCLWHPDRPGRLYLGGWRCGECSPAALAGRPTVRPPAGTTLADRRDTRAGGAAVDELEPWIVAARRTGRTAAARAELATRVYRRGRSSKPGRF